MLNWSYGISFCFFTIQRVSTEVWHVLNTEIQPVLRALHPPPSRHVTWFLRCEESVRTVEIMCSSMWWEERVDDTALGLIQLCCQWHADIIKPGIFHCQVHLAAHFLISATALLTAVIQNDCQKTKQIN